MAVNLEFDILKSALLQEYRCRYLYIVPVILLLNFSANTPWDQSWFCRTILNDFFDNNGIILNVAKKTSISNLFRIFLIYKF
jgi:hypothetical protein